jgi:hypothetical protein
MGKMSLTSSIVAEKTAELAVTEEVITETITRPVYKIKEVERIVTLPKVVEQEEIVHKPVFTVKSSEETISKPVFAIEEEKHTVIKPIYSVREELHVFTDFQKKMEQMVDVTSRKIAKANMFYLEKMENDQKVIEKLEKESKKLSITVKVLIGLTIINTIFNIFG